MGIARIWIEGRIRGLCNVGARCGPNNQEVEAIWNLVNSSQHRVNSSQHPTEFSYKFNKFNSVFNIFLNPMHSFLGLSLPFMLCTAPWAHAAPADPTSTYPEATWTGQCTAGTHQSPVDLPLKDTNSSRLPALQFSNFNSTGQLTATNTGLSGERGIHRVEAWHFGSHLKAVRIFFGKTACVSTTSKRVID